MQELLKLLFILNIEHYLQTTITVFGVTVPLAFICLGIVALISLSKKLGMFLWAKFIQAIKAELNKDSNNAI